MHRPRARTAVSLVLLSLVSLLALAAVAAAQPPVAPEAEPATTSEPVEPEEQPPAEPVEPPPAAEASPVEESPPAEAAPPQEPPPAEPDPQAPVAEPVAATGAGASQESPQPGPAEAEAAAGQTAPASPPRPAEPRAKRVAPGARSLPCDPSRDPCLTTIAALAEERACTGSPDPAACAELVADNPCFDAPRSAACGAWLFTRPCIADPASQECAIWRLAVRVRCALVPGDMGNCPNLGGGSEERIGPELGGGTKVLVGLRDPGARGEARRALAPRSPKPSAARVPQQLPLTGMPLAPPALLALALLVAGGSVRRRTVGGRSEGSRAPRLTTALLAVAAFTLAGCGADDQREPTAADPPGEESPAPPQADRDGGGKREGAEARRGTKVELGDSEFGEMLFDAKRQAIYIFERDGSGESRCYGECAKAWPPVLTKGEPDAGKGVAAGLLGTTKRRDGSVQVTYAGRPLYFYAHEAPGEVRCHNVSLNGGFWWVVGADGKRLA